MDLHIDDFCRDAARILVDLFAVFPRRHALYVEDISGPDEPDEVGLHSPRYESCLGAMLWLAEEGWLRYDVLIYRQGIDQAVLTNKAFVILSAASELRVAPVPDSPATVRQAHLTRIEQLRRALHNGRSHELDNMVRYLLSATPALLLPASPIGSEEISDSATDHDAAMSASPGTP